MKHFMKCGRHLFVKTLVLAVLIGVVAVLAGGSAYAQDQSVAEKILNIMLKSKQISQEQYNELMKQAQAEKAAQAEKLKEAQRALDQQRALEAQTALSAQKAEAAAQKTAAAAPVEKQPNDFRAWWKPTDGLHFTSENKAFDIHVGGRIQADIADAEPDNNLTKWGNGSFSSGHGSGAPTQLGGYGDQIRRARMDIDGTIYNNVEFIFQPDFAPSYKATTVVKTATLTKGVLTTTTTSLTTGPAITFADMWVGVKDIPYVGRIKVGQMYEPLSIEQMTSDNWNTFMEKALPVQALIPGRNMGIEMQNATCNDRVGWMLGYFFQQQAATSSNGVYQDTTADLFSPHLDATQFAMRLYGLPYYQNNGERLLHIGLGYSHEFRTNDVKSLANVSANNPGALDFKSSPESNISSALVDSGYFLATGVDIVDPELALVYGPFAAQAEYIWIAASGVRSASNYLPLGANHDATFNGWYTEFTYFLTGEHRPYATNASPATYQATFGRPIPNSNFDPAHGGIGAWEVAFRISQLNDNDSNSGFNGGLETDYTFGINWYLNPNVMVKMNYVHALVDAHSHGVGSNANYYGSLPTNGTDNIFETRFQIAF
jgi:phosphate-selective porin OprO/OprP